MCPIPEQVELRHLDWDRMRVKLVWAYEGKPQELHHVGPEFMTIAAWRILRGHVQATSPTAGTIRVEQGQWFFTVTDKIEHDFSDDAKIISIRSIISWPNQQMLYKHDQWITFDDMRFTGLNKAANTLTRICKRVLHLAPTLPFMEEGMLKQNCSLPQYIQLKQAMLKWVMAYHQCMRDMAYPLNMRFVTDERVNDTMRHIEQTACHAPYSRSDIEQHAGLSISQLNRLFVTHVGMTPKAYAQMQRLNFACTMLISSKMPIKQLAFAMAFKQPAHFTNWFKQSTGVSPKDYRINQQQTTANQIRQLLDMQ
ncbi:MAG: helix-turn-helix domain-containing protein [Phycisphaeraceae bacterium JB051]